MNSTPTAGPPNPQPDRAFEGQMREMNEALLISSIRQHELTEQAQKAEVRYRRLFETAKDGILILDTHTGRITDANPFLSKLLGYSIGEFLGKELWEIGLFSDNSANQAAARELQANGYIHCENLSLKTNQGQQVEVEVVANAYTEESQGIAQYNIRDITGRRKTERALDKALAYGDDIIATLREPFLVLDHDLRVRTANRSFYDAFHVSKVETENRFVYDLGNGQWDIPGLRTLLDQVLSRNQSVYDFEVEHSFPTLGRKTMLLNARPFPPDSKHPELILLAVYDVSAVRARADGLAETNRHKDEFLAMLSHELRSPLAPILNAVQLLRLQRDGTPLQKEMHGIIERQVAQLARLVDDLLEVSRISSGRIHLQEGRVDFRGIVDRAIETTQPQVGQKGQSVAKSLPDQPLWIYGDAMRLEQVVVNLLNNASKYTDRGGHIWVGLKHEGDQAVLRVRDNGMGIAPELLPHIFDLFTQADKSLDRSQGGLGIGLALVRSLVTMHRGQVEVHSTLGQGSEFVVNLPVLLASPESTAIPVPIVASPHRPLKVLAVDDNIDAAKGVAMLLRAFGHEARVAHDGASAMQAALEFVPEVVLLDIGLPITNGYQVAECIRQEPALKNVVLIAVTGYGQESDRQRSREAGFDHHLVKPVDFAKIESILSTVADHLNTTK